MSAANNSTISKMKQEDNPLITKKNGTSLRRRATSRPVSNGESRGRSVMLTITGAFGLPAKTFGGKTRF
jgi:hypothetical protein